jgi:hypothetical protein
MRPSRQELTLSNALSDPLIRSLMTADKVNPAKLESMLRRIAAQVMPSSMPSAIKGCDCNA